jgi:flagellar motor switch protein FliM
MSERLNQKEIDRLLSGEVESGAPQAASQVEPYSFLRPPSIPKHRWAALAAILDKLAADLSAMLSLRLRTSVDVAIISMEPVVYSEFILSLGPTCAAAVFPIGSRPGSRGVIDLGTDVAYYLIDRLFGGSGGMTNPGRALTPLERTLVSGIGERSIALLRDASQGRLGITAEVASFETDPTMLQIAAPGDSVLVAILEIGTDGFKGLQTICLPIASMQSFLKGGAPGLRQQTGRLSAGSEPDQALLESNLKHARLSVTARLPEILLSARKIAELTVGKTVLTGCAVDAPVEIYINEQLRFAGTLGQIRRRIGLQVSGVVSVPAPERPGQAKEGRVL